MSEKGPYHPDQEEEVLPPLPDNIPDEETDRPNPSEILPTLGEGDISPVVLGCAVFGYGIYSNQSFVQGVEPLRVLRYALRSGINAFDTCEFKSTSRDFQIRRSEYLGSMKNEE